MCITESSFCYHRQTGCEIPFINFMTFVFKLLRFLPASFPLSTHQTLLGSCSCFLSTESQSLLISRLNFIHRLSCVHPMFQLKKHPSLSTVLCPLLHTHTHTGTHGMALVMVPKFYFNLNILAIKNNYF